MGRYDALAVAVFGFLFGVFVTLGIAYLVINYAPQPQVTQVQVEGKDSILCPPEDVRK